MRLLLDEHISAAVAKGIRRRKHSIVVHAMAEWHGGAYLGCDDSALLRQALVEELALVTYDRRTIPPLLKAWAEQGQPHGGVIFVDEKTILPGDFGGLVKALLALADEAGDWDWSNRVIFMRAS